MVDDTREVHLSIASPMNVKSGSPRGDKGSSSSPLSILGSLTAVITSMVFIVYYARNLGEYLDDIYKLDLLGNLIFILSYIPAGLPFALVSYYIPLSLSVGYLYNIPLGIATAMTGSVFSGLFGFWITRTFCRAWIDEKIKSSARLSSLLLAMEIYSFKVTLMVRFLPLPFGLQNGLCAMTSITAPKFLLSSTIGLLPENLLLIYFGNSFTNIGQISHGDFGSISTHEKVLLATAVLGTVVIFILGRRMLNATLVKVARSGNKKMEDEDMLLSGTEEGNNEKGGLLGR
jgi:uncharacterized membrane protein YdjX (TVP38/TMEM64 family)